MVCMLGFDMGKHGVLKALRFLREHAIVLN
jgi:hypothetical protein